MFCTKCGVAVQPESKYCVRCGSGIAEQSAEPSPNLTPHFPDAESLSGRRVNLDFDVDIEFSPQLESGVYPQQTLRAGPARMMLTDGAILFIDSDGLKPWRKYLQLYRLKEANRPGPQPPHTIYFSKIWALKGTINAELDREFRRDPTRFRKVRGPAVGSVRGAWWINGCREWLWVQSVDYRSQDCVVFELSKVMATASRMFGIASSDSWRMGMARVYPRERHEAIARLRVEEFKQILDKLKPELSAPAFPEGYQKTLLKPPSRIGTTYYYVFWMAAAAILPIAILSGVAPPWVTVLVVVGVCVLAFRYLRRWKHRHDAKIRAENPEIKKDART